MSRYRYAGITIGAWSLAPLLARVAMDHGFSPLVTTLIGGLIGAPILLLLILRASPADWSTLRRPRGAGILVASGLLGVGGTLLNYLAIGSIAVPTAVSISNTHPLFTTGIAVFVVRTEQLTWRTTLGSALIVVGITCVTLASAS